MIDINKYINSQIANSKLVIKHDIIDKSTIRYVAGLDISFDKSDNERACAFITVYDIITNKIVYEDYDICKMKIPYISGCLGIREVPKYIKLLNKINNKPFYPNLLMIDGCGILHPREYGSASELGEMLNLPSIGVAKTLMCIDGLDEYIVKKDFKARCKNKGDYILLDGLTIENNKKKIYGAAVKSSDKADNPIYVSIGYGISLETAIEFVDKLSFYKIPEPIRNSDIKSKLYF